eukprot:5709936-Amphidinium_carterae.2
MERGAPGDHTNANSIHGSKTSTKDASTLHTSTLFGPSTGPSHGGARRTWTWCGRGRGASITTPTLLE